MIVDDAGQVQARPATSGPFIRSAVQISFGRSAWNRPNAGGRLPAGAGGQLAGLEHPLDRPLGGRPAQLGGQDPATCAAVRAGFSFFSPTASSTTCGGARRGLARRRDQRVEPAGPARGDPPVERLAGHRHPRARRAGVSRPASSRTIWPRCRDVRAGSIAG